MIKYLEQKNKKDGVSMDLSILKEYGLSVFILIGAGKGIQMLYKNMREDMRTSREDTKEMFTQIQKACSDREDRIIGIMQEQSLTLVKINDNINSNFLYLSEIKNDIKELRKGNG